VVPAGVARGGRLGETRGRGGVNLGHRRVDAGTARARARGGKFRGERAERARERRTTRRDGTSLRATPPPPPVDARGSRPRHRIKRVTQTSSRERTTNAGDRRRRRTRTRGARARGRGRRAPRSGGRRSRARARRGPWRRSWRGPASLSSGGGVSLDVTRRAARTRSCPKSHRRFITSSALFSSQPLLGPSWVSRSLGPGESRSSCGDRGALFGIDRFEHLSFTIFAYNE
jgi:hypothetical protein